MIINELCTDMEEGGGGEAGLFLSYLFCFVVKDVMLNNSNVIMFCIVCVGVRELLYNTNYLNIELSV